VTAETERRVSGQRHTSERSQAGLTLAVPRSVQRTASACCRAARESEVAARSAIRQPWLREACCRARRRRGAAESEQAASGELGCRCGLPAALSHARDLSVQVVGRAEAWDVHGLSHAPVARAARPPPAAC